MASREGMGREPHTMVRHRPVGVIGGAKTCVWDAGIGFDPVISRPLLPDGVMRTHGCRCLLPTVSNRESSCQSRPAQPVSTNALLEVHRRMTRRIGPPQGGHKATSG